MTEKRARRANDADAPASPGQRGLLVPVHEWTPQRDAKGKCIVKTTWVEREKWTPELLAKPLDFNQRGMSSWWDSIRDKYKLAVVNASRQIGKSFWACTLVVMAALLNPGWQIKYGAKTQKHARGFILPHFRYLRSLLPEDVRDSMRWSAEDQNYTFDNGSTITIAGCDKQYAEALTGQHAHLFIIDEGGAIRDLDFIVNDIALPQTLNTGGKLVIFSTPARTPGHSFKKYCDDTKAHGTLLERQIFDNPRLSDATIREYCELAGGVDSTQWKREYLVQHVTEASAAVCPEATPLRMQRITITETNLVSTRSPSIDSYIVVVPQWNPNFTGALWAHWDFARNRLVVEDELLVPKLDTEELALAMREKTEALWGAEHRVFRVVAPNVEDDLICEMSDNGWSFTGTSMKDFDTSNQKLRHSIKHRSGKPALWIHERCGDLRRQLENAVWSDKKRREIEASRMDGSYPLLLAAVVLREDMQERHDAMALDRRWRRYGLPHAHLPVRAASKVGMAMKRMFRLR